MKKILIVLALFVGFTSAYAVESFNAEVAKSATIKTKVILPFEIKNAQNPDGTDQHLPTVIAGQTRILNPNSALYIFKVTKDINHTAAFTFNGADPVNGVDLTVQWYWVDKDPKVQEWAANAFAITSSWTWAAGETTASVINVANNTHTYYAVLKVSQIKANAGILPGLRVFNVSASGQYTGL